MSVTDFENKRWREHTQKMEFRHHACLDLIRDGTVLDIGCGDGLLLSYLGKKHIVATGIDISPEAVVRCRAAGLTALEHSLDTKLPFADESFDTVVLLDVLEHLYDPLAVLVEARRVARNRIIVSVPNFSSLPARLQTLLGRVPENNRAGKGHVYWFNHPILLSLAKRAILTPGRLQMNTFSVFTRFSFVTTLWPNLFALSFVLELKK